MFNTNFSSTTSSDVATLTLAQPGNYTLLLAGAIIDTTSGSYTFVVVPQGNTPQPPPTGTPLTLGAIVSDSIAVAGEQDRYTFTLTQASLLIFDSLTNNGNLNWTLAGPAGTAVSARSFQNGETGNPVLNLVAGNYTLTVAASGTNTGAYSFRLSELSHGSPLVPGTPVSGNLNPANETDLYRFTALAGERFYFDTQAPSTVATRPGGW